MTVQAIYENGVFRPTEPVDLPDKARVEIALRVVDENRPDELAEPTPRQLKAMQELYRIMGERYNSGMHDTAERHNEHQP